MTANTGYAVLQMEQNILNNTYVFDRNSKIKEFLISRTRENRSIYTLGEVLTTLRNIIQKEAMFDKTNPSIIICTQELESAFGMQALHVAELRSLLMTQMRAVVINPINNDRKKYKLKPTLQRLIQQMPTANVKQRIFTYSEVAKYISAYILSKREELFDTRNIRVALVANDPLSAALGVDSFHRCQINDLIRKQLVPIAPRKRTSHKAMVFEAIRKTQGIHGSSKKTIMEFVNHNYKVNMKVDAIKIYRILEQGIVNGSLKMASKAGKGSRSYKLGENKGNC